MTKRNTRIKRISLLLCLLLLLPILVFKPSVTAQAETSFWDDGKLIVVSLGDSYSSGEGNEPFYHEDLPITDRIWDYDWTAHRSEVAWSSMLQFPDHGYMRALTRDVSWYFVAASGAVTTNIDYTENGTYNKKTGERGGQQRKDCLRGYSIYPMVDRLYASSTVYLPGQLDVFRNTPGLDPNDVDFVTITIGGNDVHFSSIVGTAAFNGYFDRGLYKDIKKELDHFYDGTKIENGRVTITDRTKNSTYIKIHDTYVRIHDAAPNATILVAGYPELFDPDGFTLLFDETDREFINKAVRIFNNRIEGIVKDCQQEGIPVVFCPVIDEFKGRGAYSENKSKEYINRIMFGRRSQDLTEYGLYSDYSMHPNLEGQKAYARCVQRKIDELCAGRISPTGAVRETSDERDIVLVLDTSGSMDGKPIRETRNAAVNFIETILKEDASIGIVTFSSYAMMDSDFSKDQSYLTSKARSIDAWGTTNTYDALQTAESMLENSNAAKKIIVLMSDGMPNEGLTGSDLTDYAQELRDEGILIYSLGFFSSLDYWEKDGAQSLMEGIASPGCHYEVESADDLVFFFGDVADQINGTKFVYIRIACPVDVRVSYEGETLDSTAYGNQNKRTSFGSLTFEEGEGYYGYGSDNRTKILRLREGADYKVEIYGNGEGTMTYTVGFADDTGEYSDLRVIEEVPITAQTQIESNAKRDAATVLRVDEDGDGRYDRTYRAGGPEEPEEKEFPVWGWILIGVGALILIGIVLALVLRKKRRSGTPSGTPRAYSSARTEPAVGSNPWAAAPPRGTDSPVRTEPAVGSNPWAAAPPRGTDSPVRREPAVGNNPWAAAPPAEPARTESTALRKSFVSEADPEPNVPADRQSASERPGGSRLLGSMGKRPPAAAPDETAVPKPEIRKEREVPPARGRFCRGCGAPIEDGMRFCEKCGTAIEDAPVPEPAVREEREVPYVRGSFCRKCGRPIDENAKFCENCGEKL